MCGFFCGRGGAGGVGSPKSSLTPCCLRPGSKSCQHLAKICIFDATKFRLDTSSVASFGDTISCRDQNDKEFARGLVNYNTQEAQRIIGKNTHEIEQVLGYHHYDEIIHRDNLVLIS